MITAKKLVPWLGLVFSFSILASFVFALAYNILNPWSDGEAELSKKVPIVFRICVGGGSHHFVSSGDRYNESSSSFGLSVPLTAGSALIHPDVKEGGYEQRSYILPADVWMHPGIWTVSENTEKEFAVDFSVWGLITLGLMIPILTLVALFSINKIREQFSQPIANHVGPC
jgi:hypothetical protein